MDAAVATLTDPQQAFVDELVASGCNPTEAARRAGYTHPAQEAYRLIRKPNIIAAIRSERSRLVEGDLTGLALKTLHEIFLDTGASPALKLKAAVIVLRMAGYIGSGAEHPGNGGEKTLQEMTEAELRAMAAQLRADAHMPADAIAHVPASPDAAQPQSQQSH